MLAGLKYRSVWDSVLDRNPDFYCKRMEYSGCLDEVVAETQRIVGTPAFLRTDDDVLDLALHPPRIIRAVLDYKISNEDEGLLDLVTESSDVALSVYRGDIDSAEQLERFKKRVKRMDDRLLYSELKQPSDLASWSASKPFRSHATALRINSQIGGDVLFIALGHGGVAPGMDVFLRYCKMSGSDGSVFYPVRFSYHKLGDQVPRVDEGELRHIVRSALGKTVVLFDEDICTGESLLNASKYFAALRPVCFTNLDMFTEKEKPLKKYLMPLNLDDDGEIKYLTHDFLKEKWIEENNFSSLNEIKFPKSNENRIISKKPFEYEIFNLYTLGLFAKH